MLGGTLSNIMKAIYLLLRVKKTVIKTHRQLQEIRAQIYVSINFFDYIFEMQIWTTNYQKTERFSWQYVLTEQRGEARFIKRFAVP